MQFIRNVRRLLLRSSLLRITVLLVFAVCVVAYTLFAGQDRGTGTGEPHRKTACLFLKVKRVCLVCISLCNNENTSIKFQCQRPPNEVTL